MSGPSTDIPLINVPLVGPNMQISEPWFMFLMQLFFRTGGTSGLTDADANGLTRSRKGDMDRSHDEAVPVSQRVSQDRRDDEAVPRRHSQPQLVLTKEIYKPLTLIRAYVGLGADIPAGWQLADGSNGTPDLRDKFIVGAGNLYTQNTTGGSTTIAVTTGTVQSGAGATVVTGVTAPYVQPYYAAAYIINTKTVTIVTDAKLR
jgi:hypothetical protein